MTRVVITLLASVTLASSSIAAQGPRPVAVTGWSGIAPGPHAVGYELLYLEDASRTLFPDTGAASGAAVPRIVPVRIWYPVRASTAARMTIAAVIADGAGGRSAAAADVAAGLLARTMAIHAYAASKYDRAGGVALVAADTVGLVARVLATRTGARRGGPAAPGPRRPLVVFAGGTAHTTDENLALWEHLASHGYVVAAMPTVAVDAAAEQAYLPDDAAGLETVTRDIETAIARLRLRPDVDASRVAVAGFSFGGAAALATAARHRGVRAVVALDASLIARRYLPMIRSAPLFDARRIGVPVLELHRADTGSVDLALLESIERSERTSIELAGLDHVDFNSYLLLYAPLLRERGPRAVRDSALAAKEASYRAMVETARLFLDDALGRATGDLDAALRAEGAVWRDVAPSTIRVRRWPARRGAAAPPGEDAKR